jgi:hypothetical protein
LVTFVRPRMIIEVAVVSLNNDIPMLGCPIHKFVVLLVNQGECDNFQVSTGVPGILDMFHKKVRIII